MSDKEKDNSKKPKKDEEDIGEVSYTYWKRDSDIKADHKGFQPQKASTTVDVNQNNNNVGSAWNKAGTWEEKPITKKMFEEFFNDYFKKNEKKYKNTFIFDEASGYSGEVRNFFLIIFFYFFQTYFVFTRGKIKFFYDCSIKLKIKGINDYENLDTVITVKNLNNEDEDELPEYEYDSMDSKSSSKRYPLVQCFKENKKEIETDIIKILEDMKNHFTK